MELGMKVIVTRTKLNNSEKMRVMARLEFQLIAAWVLRKMGS